MANGHLSVQERCCSVHLLNTPRVTRHTPFIPVHWQLMYSIGFEDRVISFFVCLFFVFFDYPATWAAAWHLRRIYRSPFLEVGCCHKCKVRLKMGGIPKMTAGFLTAGKTHNILIVTKLWRRSEGQKETQKETHTHTHTNTHTQNQKHKIQEGSIRVKGKWGGGGVGEMGWGGGGREIPKMTLAGFLTAYKFKAHNILINTKLKSSQRNTHIKIYIYTTNTKYKRVH